jgi:hypothetical protein
MMKALAFVLGGKQVFAARVNLAAVMMPERLSKRRFDGASKVQYWRAPILGLLWVDGG